MQISLIPQRQDRPLTVFKSGDILTINGEAFDLSGIPDGATLPQSAMVCDWLASDIERIGGVLHLTLILPHGAHAPQETLFPQPLSAQDGAISLPAYSLEEEDA